MHQQPDALPYRLHAVTREPTTAQLLPLLPLLLHPMPRAMPQLPPPTQHQLYDCQA